MSRFNFNAGLASLCMLFLLFFVFASCKKEKDLEIILPTTKFTSDTSIFVEATHPYSVKSYEWKILELDKIVSTSQSFVLYAEKTGTYTLQLTVRTGMLRKIVKSVIIYILPGKGKIGSFFSDTSGPKHKISIWAKGTTYLGKAYQDSIYIDQAAGPNFPNTNPCIFVVALWLPAGEYTYWYQYSVSPNPSSINSYSRGSSSCKIDGNCVSIF